MITRGEIHWADLGVASGSRPAKRRPILVVQSDPYNASRLATVVAAVSVAMADGSVFAGTLAFFFSAFAVLTVAYYHYMQTHIYTAIGLAFLISLATAITEAKSSKGFDNFFVPF